MRKLAWLAVVVGLIGGLSAGCAKANPVAPSQTPEQGKLLFALDAASDNIATGKVTITKGNITQVLPITITGHTGSVAFSAVQVGHWSIQVQLFDADGVEIYSGDGTAVVAKNATTTATIRVNHNTGNLTIIVNTDSTFTVTYAGNNHSSGSVPVDSKTYVQGDSVIVLGNTGGLVTAQTQDGITLVFNGWNTQADGKGTTYSAGQTFAMGTAGVTLFAKWSVIGATGPGGGLVFYDKGSVSNGWRYLEAAPADQAADRQWLTQVPPPVTGATATGIGAGVVNTATIVSVQGAPTGGFTPYAAYVCSELVLNGHSDWFLPSKDELALMYTNLKLAGVGGFANAGYWSSSEFDVNTAWNQYFVTGGQGNDDKNWNNNVRAIRAF